MALSEYSDRWDRKPVLRTIYADFHDRILDACIPGLTIEIGAGAGHLKRRKRDVIATDIQFAPWLGCLADAQRLPFAANVAANIVMVDVLHHVEFPVLFFREADRVLASGGRVIMIEPAMTWGSTLFYRLLHHEPMRMRADPLIEGKPDPQRDPYDGNQSVPTLLATRDRARFERMFPGLKVRRVDWFSLAAYPLSGGYKSWSLISDRLARHAIRLERAIEPVVGRWTAFRLMLVVEKVEASVR
jgi:SAM-dependent methyltransferase